MLASIIIGILIFAYASWMMVSFFKKSKQGKCATCAIKDSCSSGCSIVSKEERLDVLKRTLGEQK
jgi:radical SAM protein with 4Fe4S-binding SPASM domain